MWCLSHFALLEACERHEIGEQTLGQLELPHAKSPDSPFNRTAILKLNGQSSWDGFRQNGSLQLS